MAVPKKGISYTSETNSMTGTTLGRNSIATALLSPSLVCASLSLKLILGSPKKVVNGFDVEVMRKPDWILCAKIPSVSRWT